MPWRLILMIIVVAVFLVFITFNMENRCDISFFGAVIPQVPIFITIFISFVFGLLFTIPLIFMILRKRNLKHQTAQAPVSAEAAIEPSYAEQEYQMKPPADDKIKKDAAEAKKRFLSKRRDKK